MNVAGKETERRARALYEAREKRVPIARLTSADPTLSMDDGCIVQQEFTALLVRDGDIVIGYKAGLTYAHAAIAAVMAGLEIVDSRIENWRIRLADTIADLASNGAAVFGRAVTPSPDTDYRLVGMVFSRNGELVATGAAALGDPVVVVAWLANILGERGIVLEAGQVIMTGALHAAVPLSAGDTFAAEFDRLGSITLHVDGRES